MNILQVSAGLGGELGILSTQRSIDRNSKPLMIVVSDYID